MDNVDELYRLPLEEFTKARNTLAKTLSGDEKRIVASLPKPTLPMWAVNQLYWNDRATYKALIDAAETLRAAHRAVLGGKKADLRKPDAVHRAALDRAAGKATRLLEQAAGRVSDPARDTIRRALAALPNDEQAGRLTREPEPAGFSLLAGITPRPVKTTQKKPDEAAARRDALREQQRAEQARQKAARERENALTEARKDLKTAQRAAERATFVARKAESELARARKAEEQAASQLKDAERRLAELDRG